MLTLEHYVKVSSSRFNNLGVWEAKIYLSNSISQQVIQICLEQPQTHRVGQPFSVIKNPPNISSLQSTVSECHVSEQWPPPSVCHSPRDPSSPCQSSHSLLDHIQTGAEQQLQPAPAPSQWPLYWLLEPLQASPSASWPPTPASGGESHQQQGAAKREELPTTGGSKAGAITNNRGKESAMNHGAESTPNHQWRWKYSHFNLKKGARKELPNNKWKKIALNWPQQRGKSASNHQKYGEGKLSESSIKCIIIGGSGLNKQQQELRKSSKKKLNSRDKESASNHQQQREDKRSESPTTGDRKVLRITNNRKRKTLSITNNRGQGSAPTAGGRKTLPMTTNRGQESVLNKPLQWDWKKKLIITSNSQKECAHSH